MGSHVLFDKYFNTDGINMIFVLDMESNQFNLYIISIDLDSYWYFLVGFKLLLQIYYYIMLLA